MNETHFVLEQLQNHDEIEISTKAVNATISLLKEGLTVPFISRYRRHLTEGLDSSNVRIIEQYVMTFE